jgi:2-phosphosulfolactate phosphatase
MKIDAILSPRELPALLETDLRETVCIVFDVLRATSTFVTALQNGAREIIPVGEISEALEIKKQRPEVLLGGERNGVRISANGIVFDFGNSPREYTPEKVRGKTIVSTTTNGTRALRACAKAKMILASSFLNLSATAQFLQGEKSQNILLICAGTRENPALEDILAAGAMIEMLTESSKPLPPLGRGEGVLQMSDSAQIAFHAYANAKSNFVETVFAAENARRVLAIPELREDVHFCLQRDVFPLVAKMKDGAISV